MLFKKKQKKYEIKEWVDQMQKDLISLTDTASGMDSLIQSYYSHRDRFKVETNIPLTLVQTAAGNIENLLANRSLALKTLVSHPRPAAGKRVESVNPELKSLDASSTTAALKRGGGGGSVKMQSGLERGNEALLNGGVVALRRQVGPRLLQPAGGTD
ncbi:unnamed protein product [Merluccius merluccius]